MSTESAGEVALAPSGVKTSARERDAFYLGLSLTMLVIVLAGFGPRMFFRDAVDLPPIAPDVYIHAIAMTAWFALYLTQALLVVRGRVALHRQLGVAALTTAIFIVLTGVSANLAFPARSPGLDPATNPDGALQLTTTTVVINFTALLFFSVFVLSGYLSRKTPELHKRFMAWASLVIVFPALDRISRWSIFGGSSPIDSEGSIQGSFWAFVPFWMLIALLFVYDFRKHGRPHWVSVTGLCTLFGVGMVLVPLAIQSEAVRRWVAVLMAG